VNQSADLQIREAVSNAINLIPMLRDEIFFSGAVETTSSGVIN